MGRKLYPPYIDGKIPAFTYAGAGSGTGIEVPFRQNRAVSRNQYSQMACKFKTVSTNEYVWTIYSDDIYTKNGNYYVRFNLDGINPDNSNKTYAESLSIGFYYKIQVAYVDADNVVGYFSDVGVVKYTAKPYLAIEGLYSNRKNTENGGINYIGVYSQNQYDIRDVTEKIYSYSFIMLDEDGSVFFNTGEQLHNSSTDIEPFESHDSFVCNKELDVGHTYRLKYNVTTINGLECSSDTYYIKRDDTVKANINATLHTESNFENGYISLRLVATDDKVCTGSFIITRADSSDNYKTWEEMFRFSLRKENPNKELFKDFTVEQGINYQYALTQYNSKGMYSNKLYSETTFVDFEDMFLFDGKRQLKIRFNPNVSSFKNDYLEGKMDTIGGKYPFIFRNGTVKYKEFPISGLLSYLSDDQEFFINKDNLGYVEFYGTDLTWDNVRAERKFKLAALEWLSNGEPKLFRSPTEGNYFVRLNNVSMTPHAQTGRMLHSFSATAFEIGEASMETLRKYDMFPETAEFESSIIHFKSISLDQRQQILPDDFVPTAENLMSATGTSQYINPNNKLKIPNVYLGRFENMLPNSIIGLEYAVSDNSNGIQLITIGRTGTYEINTLDNPVIGVFLLWTEDSYHQFSGTFTYGYYASVFISSFDKIESIIREDYCSQWIGKHNDIIEEDAYMIRADENTESYNNTINSINDTQNKYYGLNNIKEKFGRIYWIRFTTREIVPIYIGRSRESEYRDMYRCYRDSAHVQPCIVKDIIDINVYRDMETGRLFDGRDLKLRLQKIGEYWDTDTNSWEPINDGGARSGYVYFSDIGFINDPDIYWTDDTQEPWTSDINDNYNVDRLYKFSINHVDNNIDIKSIERYVLTDLKDVSHISMGRMLVCECFYCLTEMTYTIEGDLSAYASDYLTIGNIIDQKQAYDTAKTAFVTFISGGAEAGGAAHQSAPSNDVHFKQLMETKQTYYNSLAMILARMEEEDAIREESEREPEIGG